MLPGEGPEPEVLPVRMGQSEDADSGFWPTFSLPRLPLRLMVDSPARGSAPGIPKGRQSSQEGPLKEQSTFKTGLQQGLPHRAMVPQSHLPTQPSGTIFPSLQW